MDPSRMYYNKSKTKIAKHLSKSALRKRGINKVKLKKATDLVRRITIPKRLDSKP